MLPRSITAKTLWDARRGLTSWTVGTALVGAMYASFFPSMSGGDMADVYDSFPEAMREAFNLDELSTAAGYLGSTPFGVVVPLLVLFYGAATGARLIAGDEESGYLDLLVAHPVSRTRLVVQRFAALAAGAGFIGLAVFVMMMVVRGPAELGDVAVADFAAQCLNLVLLGITFGALAVCLGGFTGHRALVFGVTGGAGVLAYAANAFGGQIGLSWTERLSPFHYYIGGEPLKHGFQWADAGILAAVSALLVAAGTYRFNHRDIAV